jgi:dipeptidyl aminopeptidase/acylaminoacyl peptidase
LLTDPDTASGTTWNRAGTQLLISSVPLDRTAAGGRRDTVATTVSLVDPLKPEQRRVVAELPGTGWFGFEFTPDDRAVFVTRYVRSTLSEVWKLDLATGERTRVLPSAGGEAAYGNLEITPDGKRMFLATNERSEFIQLAEYRFDTGALRILSEHIPWDAESLALSYDGQRLAAVFNVDGRDELRLFDAATGRELERPRLPPGRISGLRWHRSRTSELGLTLNSSTSPAEVLALDTASGSVQKWTAALVEGVDPAQFGAPELVRWKSFDGRTISGLLTLPPKQFTGPRPVLISIHGGPESQARVAFRGRTNYFINELGIALIEPNVRGSGGYGKTFLDLDNGVKREDSVRDIGALLDWIKSDSRLDAKRVMVIGGSYGGYMSLAVAAAYPARIAGAIDIVGISNFVTFLRNTESYRRDLRRVEYGDERDATMRNFLERVSPLSNAQKIVKPLFVVQGRNDPRVPYTEAEQIVEKVRANGTPVWYLRAENEGHGFVRKENADFQFYATTLSSALSAAD